MRALILNGACAAMLVAGCSSKSSMSLVVVSVDSDAPLADVATLHVRATVGSTTREFDVHPTSGSTLTIPPAQSFGIDVPRSLTGVLALHVDARDSSDGIVASGDGSGAISVGARADVAVRLAAAAVDADMAQPAAADMGGAGPDLAQSPGDMVVIVPAMLTIDKSMQSFGDITVGKTSTMASFLVVNAGGMPTSIATLATGGANVGEFTIDTDCGPALVPGGRCHVTASITPTGAGSKQATFTLTATQGGSVGGTLTANALTPGAVKIAQPSGDCGSSLLNMQSTTTASFTVKNTGASPTSALSVATSDAQFQASGCTGMTLAANASCTVTVKFTPTTAGTQNASLNVSATTGGTDTASLVGVGLKPAALRLSPDHYNFPTTQRLSTSGPTVSFVLNNDGDVPSATLALATLTGSGASDGSFKITNDACQGGPLGPAPAICMITVQFTPQVTGANSATLNINTTAGTVILASMTGTATPTWVVEAADLTLPPLRALWAADDADVYAVGDSGTIVYRDGTGKWSTRTLSTTVSPVPNLTAVSGTSRTDVYIAGGGIYHSIDSSTWTTWQAGAFTGVFVLNRNDIWGSYSHLDGSNNTVSAIYRFTSGTGWAQVLSNGSPAPGESALWGTSGTDMFTFGGDLSCGLGVCSSDAVIWHPDNSGSWLRQFDKNVGGPGAQVSSMWGFGSPTNNVYATVYVSPAPTPLHSAGDGTWTALGGSAPKGCSAVWGANATNLWFGCGKSLYAFDGTMWAAPFSTTFSGVHALYGTSVNNVYAVGDDASSKGLIYHYY